MWLLPRARTDAVVLQPARALSTSSPSGTSRDLRPLGSPSMPFTMLFLTVSLPATRSTASQGPAEGGQMGKNTGDERAHGDSCRGAQANWAPTGVVVKTTLQDPTGRSCFLQPSSIHRAATRPPRLGPRYGSDIPLDMVPTSPSRGPATRSTTLHLRRALDKNSAVPRCGYRAE